MSSQSAHAETILRIGAGLALLALPAMLATTFIMHFEQLGEFLAFGWTRTHLNPDLFYAKLTVADGGWRFFILPHYVGYLTIPVFLAASLALARAIYPSQPLTAIAGAAVAATGTVFMGGVFGTWLAFAPAATLGPEAGVEALATLIRMQGALQFTTILSGLSLVGMFILGIGLIRARLIPNWSAWSFTLGNLMTAIFMDLDNWMLIGTGLMFMGLLPLALRIWSGQDGQSEVGVVA